MTPPTHTLQALSRPDLQALQCAEGQFGRAPVVTHQPHVTAGCESRLDTFSGVAGHVRTRHGQIIAEDHAIEAQLAAQDVLQPATEKPAGCSSTCG